MLPEAISYAALAVTILMFAAWPLALLTRNNGIADLIWGPGILLVCMVSYDFHYLRTNEHNTINLLVILWSHRLLWYLWSRFRWKHEDFRYAQMRASWGRQAWWRSLLQVFVLQGVLMLIISLPVVLANATSGFQNPDVVFYPALALAIAGLLIETIADYQKARFKKQPGNEGRVMQSGLWRFSRHPNYFGEVLFWWGIFLMSVGAGYWYAGIVSPLLITFLILRVSGIPLLEKHHAGNPEYQQYAARTSLFFPKPPRQN